MVLAVDAKTQFASLQAILARQKSVPITKQTQGADEVFDQFAWTVVLTFQEKSEIFYNEGLYFYNSKKL